ncbi:MAG: NOL1/NOP2/sun family putative RNA methylase [Anaerolineaceae bacterium]|nr:NOL1/NOP2/sun family putative RNA methylase [Anaerolineaceae bacterium]
MAKRKQKQQENTQKPQAAMLERFLPLLHSEEIQALMIELEQPLYPSFRMNPLKVGQTDEVNQWAQHYQWQLKPVPFCETGFWVTDSPSSISKTIEHSLGHYYIQDAASMLPVELFDFNKLEEHPLILDMAASPGGKTTHLVSRTQDQALIIANDSSRERLTALRIVLQNWGSSHVGVTNYPGEYFGYWFPETFDAILLDAPCSMQGLRESDSHAIKSITQKEINNLATRQSKLLESALRALKMGGQVVYSTCTLTVEENEMVLDELLNQFHQQIQIDPIENVLKKPSPALDKFEQFAFNPQVANAARIWPFRFGTAGFFAARLTKLNEIESKVKYPPSRPLSAANWFIYPEKQQSDLIQQINNLYGIHLENLIEKYDWQIWQYKNYLHCFPGKFMENFPDLPVQSLGLPLAEISDNEYLLSHEFVTRFGGLASAHVYSVEDDLLFNWMRGEDLVNSARQSATLLIMRDHAGRILGRGKPVGERIRNLMPKRALIHDLN